MSTYGYVRVSTEEQVKDGVSLETQIEQIKAYCKFKQLPDPQILLEKGVSGGLPLDERPIGKQLTWLKGATIIVTKLDRLFRSSLDCQQVLASWEKKGTSVHILNMGGNSLDTQSAIGKLFIQLVAGMAEFEKNMISERTRDALKFKRLNGERTSRYAPFGFAYEGDKMVPIPEQQVLADDIRLMRGQGLTLQAIATALQTRGAPTPRGGRWTPGQIKRICDRKETVKAA